MKPFHQTSPRKGSLGLQLFGALLAVLMPSHSSDAKPLRPERIQAHWVFPVSDSLSPLQSWIEIRDLSDQTLLSRVSLGTLIHSGRFELEFERDNSILLYFAGRENSRDRVLIAASLLRDGWFAPVALCSRGHRIPKCDVQLNYSEQSQTIDLRVTFSN